MHTSTKTYFVAQNIPTLTHIRNNTTPEPAFNDSSIDAVQKAWDENTRMRCLNGPAYVRKSDLIKARVCFVNKDFYLYVEAPPAILNQQGIQTGERRSNLIPY